MKWIHLSDLHLGKKLYEFSLIEDQRYILDRILSIIDQQEVKGVLLAGDIYDKPVPPADAVLLFDRFLTELADRKLEVFVISGNHDSRERLCFGSKIMEKSGIHLAPVFSGEIFPETVRDAHGEIRVWMMPFLKPADVRHFLSEEEIQGYNDAVNAVIRHMKIDREERNLLVAHQFVTGAQRSDSEDISVGGLDNIDASAFNAFDYTALGHIHSPQKIAGICGRYCGTPLKYSFSEARQIKSALIVDMGAKGDIRFEEIPLTPLRELREIRGTYEELTSLKNYKDANTADYLHITLTDEEDVHDALGRLRTIYPNIMLLDYDNMRTRSRDVPELPAEAEKKSETDLFGELFEMQNGRSMEEEERTYIGALFERIREEMI